MVHWFLRGGPVMWPLLICSVVALAAALERAWFWVQEHRCRDDEVVHRILHLTGRGHFDESAASARNSRDAVARILHNGLTHHHFSLEGALEVAANAELKRMKRSLGVMDTIITVAPLLGIFGTVTGILTAFSALEGRIPDPRTVSAGIAEAVITTVAGLAIAIPLVIAYNYFCAQVEEASGHISAHVTNFQILYQKGKHRAAGTLAQDTVTAGDRA